MILQNNDEVSLVIVTKGVEMISNNCKCLGDRRALMLMRMCLHHSLYRVHLSESDAELE